MAERSAIEEFRHRLENAGVLTIIEREEAPNRLYVICGPNGYEFPEEIYDGIEARLVETIGVSSLDEDHEFNREYAHHILIWKVNGWKT